MKRRTYEVVAVAGLLLLVAGFIGAGIGDRQARRTHESAHIAAELVPEGLLVLETQRPLLSATTFTDPAQLTRALSSLGLPGFDDMLSWTIDSTDASGIRVTYRCTPLVWLYDCGSHVADKIIDIRSRTSGGKLIGAVDVISRTQVRVVYRWSWQGSTSS